MAFSIQAITSFDNPKPAFFMNWDFIPRVSDRISHNLKLYEVLQVTLKHNGSYSPDVTLQLREL